MAGAVFRADLIKALENGIGRGAAVHAAEILLAEASIAQIDEVRNLLPDDLKVVLAAGLQPDFDCVFDDQIEGVTQK